jgi:hypothetical protein
MSGSRMIARDLSGAKSFALSITAENVPGSYDGIGISLSYELVIACQVGGVLDKSHVFPIFLIGPSATPTSLKTCQDTAKFTMESAETETGPGRLTLYCPFKTVQNSDPREFLVKRGNGIVASVKIPTAVAVGGQLVGVVSLEKSNSEVTAATASFVRKEKFRAEFSETAEIGKIALDMEGIVARRFSIAIPFSGTNDFETDIVSVSHLIEFTFMGKSGTWKWSSPITVFPPEISLTKPRVIAINRDLN